jgi:hypothetical protein
LASAGISALIAESSLSTEPIDWNLGDASVSFSFGAVQDSKIKKANKIEWCFILVEMFPPI